MPDNKADTSNARDECHYVISLRGAESLGTESLATYLFDQAVVEEPFRISILRLGMIEELQQIGIASLVHLKRITEVLLVVIEGRLQYRVVFDSGVLAQHLLAHGSVCSGQRQSISEAAQKIQRNLSVFGIFQPRFPSGDGCGRESSIFASWPDP